MTSPTKRTVQSLVDRISDAVTTGELTKLTETIAMPLPVHQYQSVNVFTSHAKLFGRLRRKSARARVRGARCLRSKVAAVGLPRGETTRAWVDWSYSTAKDASSGRMTTHSTLIYLRHGPQGVKIEMIHCLGDDEQKDASRADPAPRSTTEQTA